jgi:hypothetical protein
VNRPASASASTDIIASTKVVGSERSRSGDAAGQVLVQKAGRVDTGLGHRVLHRVDLVGLSKDHAVAASLSTPCPLELRAPAVHHSAGRNLRW